MDGGQFVREARTRAGITQRLLAGRAGVSQSLVARIEAGSVDPPFDRLLQLVRACGFDLDIHVVPLDEDAWTLVERSASASPDERLDRMLEGVDLLEAGREARGRD
jgi:transcriptional regulator with XRE-family HTH domain